MSQSDLADLMKTKQSVISRFENMGRLPNYDFIARLSSALGHSPGMTLYGDYMALVPHEQQPIIKQLAEKGNLSTKTFVQRILDQSIAGIPIKTNASSADCGTVSILANKPLTVFISSADPLLEDPKGTADQLKADLALAS
jgi:transcriptional regulator with XRE-family HTH domain